VSSILKALRKIESKTPVPEGVGKWPYNAGPDDNSGRRTGAGRYRTGLLFALCLTISLGGAGYVYKKKPEIFDTLLNNKKIKPPAPTGDIEASVVPKAETEVAPGPAMEKRKRLAPPRPARKTAAPVVSPRRRTTPRAAGSPEKPIIGDSRLKLLQKASPQKPNRDVVARSAKAQPSNQRMVQPRPARRRTTPRATGSPGKIIIGDSRLKLQAIAWSSDSKQRIAVINGQVLREGDAVDGILVSEIGREDVTVKEGGQLRKLVFRVQ
jgi:hypothetical protein